MFCMHHWLYFAGYVQALMDCVIEIASQQDDLDLSIPKEPPPPLSAAFTVTDKEEAVHLHTTRFKSH